MNKEEIKIYNSELNIDGTISQLIDWAYRYDSDYTDEALLYISEKAKEIGFSEKEYLIPILVKKNRNRDKNTLPYEEMKLDKLHNCNISYSETKDYGEVEIMEDLDYVLISITGMDSEGDFIAANKVSVEEFMSGEDNFLENLIGETLFYGKQRIEDFS